MKILIADDHELFLKGLEFIIKDWNNEIELVAAHSYTDIFKILEQEKDFTLIMTDLAMPGANWKEALSHIHQQVPDTPIIILSAVFDKEIVQKTIELGVSGYIPKTFSNAIILSALNLVVSGGMYIPPELLNGNALHQELEPLFETAASPSKVLTPRQIEVIECASQGKSNKQIAYELGLTEGTVKLHITAILKGLNVYNRTGAVMEAARLGLIKKNDG